jgi:uncharacterized membrane protein
MKKKVKQILAIIMVILLLCMYLWFLVASIFARPEAHAMFLAAVATTIFFPILLFIYIRTAELLRGKGAEKPQEDDKKKKENK